MDKTSSQDRSSSAWEEAVLPFFQSSFEAGANLRIVSSTLLKTGISRHAGLEQVVGVGTADLDGVHGGAAGFDRLYVARGEFSLV